MSAPQHEPVRVVVVGGGRFGSLHAATLADLAEARLVGVVERDPRKGAELSRALPGVSIYQEIEPALQQADAEAFVIATPTAMHVPLARRVLEAGRFALVEKPLAQTLTEAESLAELPGAPLQAGAQRLMAGHIQLFSPLFRQLQQQVRQRGALRHLQAVRHRPAVTAERFPGEPPLRLLMVHDLYLTAALLGDAEPVSWRARHVRRGDGAVELTLAELQWPDGAVASLTASYLSPPGQAEDGFDRLEVLGRGWGARVVLNPQPLELWAERALWPVALDIHADPPAGWLAEELRHFCRVVRGREPICRGARYQDALRVQRWLEWLEAAALQDQAPPQFFGEKSNA